MSQFKVGLLKILSFPILNSFLRLVLYPIRSLIPTEQLVRIPVVGLVSVQYPDLDEFVMLGDGRDSLASRIYWQGTNSFESSETTVYRALLSSVDTIFDIGGNTGLYALIAGSHTHPQLVYTFEPMPDIAETLRRNVVTNQFEKIKVFEMALTDRDGEISLYVPIQSTLPMGSSTDASFRRNTQEIKVKAVMLDTFVNDYQVEKIDFMKIDTESTEPAVLRGGEQTIVRDRPIIMCEILKAQPAAKITQFFDGKNYKIYGIQDTGIQLLQTISVSPDVTNFLFVPEEKQLKQLQALMLPQANEK